MKTPFERPAQQLSIDEDLKNAADSLLIVIRSKHGDDTPGFLKSLRVVGAYLGMAAQAEERELAKAQAEYVAAHTEDFRMFRRNLKGKK